MSAIRNVLAGLSMLGASVGVGVAASGPATASSIPGRSGGSHTKVPPKIVIGSTNFPEQVIIANLYGDVLTHAGYKVILKTDLGTRQEVEPALAHGALDLYPDYVGTLLLYLHTSAGASADVLAKAVPALDQVLATQGATTLAPAPAVDTNVFAVTATTAARYHLKNLSDLRKVASKMVLGGPSECPQNATCEVGLEKVYGLHFKGFVSTDESGPISVAALKTGRAQVVEFFSSDGNAVRNHFVELVDNKHLQAADNVVPVIRKSVDAKAVSSALDALSSKLTTTQLSELNIKVTFGHESPQAVASAWLAHEHLG